MKHKKHILSILALMLSLVLCFNIAGSVRPVPASAASSSEIKQELDELEERNSQIEEELNALRGQLSDNREELSELVAQKDLVDREIALLYESYLSVCTQAKE